MTDKRDIQKCMDLVAFIVYIIIKLDGTYLYKHNNKEKQNPCDPKSATNLQQQ